MTITEWALRIGIPRSALVHRLENWPLEQALTTPHFCPKEQRPKHKPVPGVLHGSQLPTSKLTNKLVRDIRRSMSGGETIKSLANRIGVSQRTVYSAAVGRSWKHVAEPVIRPRDAVRFGQQKQRKLTEFTTPAIAQTRRRLPPHPLDRETRFTAIEPITLYVPGSPAGLTLSPGYKLGFDAVRKAVIAERKGKRPHEMSFTWLGILGLHRHKVII